MSVQGSAEGRKMLRRRRRRPKRGKGLTDFHLALAAREGRIPELRAEGSRERTGRFDHDASTPQCRIDDEAAAFALLLLFLRTTFWRGEARGDGRAHNIAFPASQARTPESRTTKPPHPFPRQRCNRRPGEEAWMGGRLVWISHLVLSSDALSCCLAPCRLGGE